MLASRGAQGDNIAGCKQHAESKHSDGDHEVFLGIVI
jgi:hypothetical protein